MVSHEHEVPTTFRIGEWNQWPRRYCIPSLGDDERSKAGIKTSVKKILRSLPLPFLACLIKEKGHTYIESETHNQTESPLLQPPVDKRRKP